MKYEDSLVRNAEIVKKIDKIKKSRWRRFLAWWKKWWKK